jgi:DNA-binding transcriptional regulator YdaS (Cro superfamily)
MRALRHVLATRLEISDRTLENIIYGYRKPSTNVIEAIPRATEGAITIERVLRWHRLYGCDPRRRPRNAQPAQPADDEPGGA